MPALDLGQVANGGEKPGAADNSLVVTFTAVTESDDFLMLILAADNLTASTPTISSVVDSKGNLWTLTDGGGRTASAGAGIVSYFWRCWVSAPHAIGDTLTITLSGNVISKSAIVVGGRWLSQGGAFVKTTAAGLAIAAPSMSIVPPIAGSMVIGMVGHENGAQPTPDTDTLEGSWSAIRWKASSAGTAGTDVVAYSQTKIVSGVANQTWNPGNAANDLIICLIAVEPLVTPPANKLDLPSANFESVDAVAGFQSQTLWNQREVNGTSGVLTFNAIDGTKSVQFTKTVAAASNVDWLQSDANAPELAVTPGLTYTFGGSFRRSQGSGDVACVIEWMSAAGAVLSTSVGANIPARQSGRIQAHVTAVAPANAAFARLICRAITSMSVNHTINGDRFYFYAGKNGGYIEPVAPGITNRPKVLVFGTNVAKPIKHRAGGTFTEKQMKIRAGGSWVNV